MEKIGDQARETRYIGGIFEETIKAGGVPEAVHHLTISGQTIAVLKTQPKLVDPNITLPLVNDTHYLHQDHLNSVVMITDNQGKVVEKNHYDVFGKKRLAIIDPANQTIYAAGFLPITDRSYTDHRYLNGQELIHMKGRVYDPTFGRFLSADPHIQSPLMSQSLNRYSYVMNNPLSMTDPSGYFFSWLKKLFKKIMRTIKRIIKRIVAVIKKVIDIHLKVLKSVVNFVKENWRAIVAIVVTVVVTVVTAGMMSAQAACYSSMWAAGTAAMSAGGFAAIGGAFIGGFAGGLISTGSLKGALMGGLTAAAFAGVGAGFSKFAAGNAMNGVTGVFTQGAFKGLTGIQAFGQSISHGLVGGLSSKLSGGSFSKGALISFLNKGASRAVSSVNLFVSTVKHAILGGAISKYIAGGSFSAGARMAAMATFFNEGGGNVYKFVKDIGNRIKQSWGNNSFGGGAYENDGPHQYSKSPAHDIFDHPDVRAEMTDAYNDAQIGTPNAHEEGGWVNNDGTVDRWPSGSQAAITPSQPSNNQIGEFHIHPNSSPYLPQPSPADLIYQSGPAAVMTVDGTIYYY